MDFSQIYLSLLVYLTQRLALRSELYTKQTLTALHDKNNAWLGLGSAVMTMWDQRKIPTALGGVGLITCYLIAVYLLHISIPAVLNAQVFNATVPITQQTRLSRASFSGSASSGK